MIKDNQHQMNRLRFLLDALTITAAYFLTYFLFFYVIPNESFLGGTFSVEAYAEDGVTVLEYLVGPKDYVWAIAYILPLHLLIYVISRLYTPMRVTGRRIEAFRVFIANLTSVMIIAIVYWLFIKKYSIHFSRVFLFEFGFINTCAIVFQRNIIRLILISIRKRGANQKHLLVLGFSRSCTRLLDCILRNPQWGYVVDGILDDGSAPGTEYKGFQVIGDLSKLSEILSGNTVDEVFVALRLREYEKLENVVHTCEKAGVMTKFIPDYGNLMSNRPYTEELAGLPIIYIRHVPLNDMLNAFLKRSVDIFGSLFAIVLFSPVMLITAVLVKLSSPGPIIFKQERVGLHNKPFMMYKFRSMGVQKDEDEEKEWTTRNDPRVTKVGKIIRKTSIDELPQLFNVLAGKMSLVGPRPERPQFVEKFKEEIPRYMVKHQVRPGLTGWAQVNGLRGDTSIRDRIDHDLYYIENWTLGLDFKIIFLTFFKGFINKNAY